MTEWPLLLHGAASWAAAAMLVAVGITVHREARRKALPVRVWMAVWWWSIGAVFFLRGLQTLVAAWWGWSLAAFWTVEEMIIAAFLVAFFGLTVALLYIYRGWDRVWPVVAAYYVMVFAIVEHGFKALAPAGVTMDKGMPELAFAGQPGQIAGAGYMAVLAFGPPVMALFLHASLFFRAPTSLHQFRVGMSSLAIVVVFLAIGAEDLVEGGQAVYLEAGLSLLAGLLAYVTYRPGPRLQHHLEKAVEEEDGRAATYRRRASE